MSSGRQQKENDRQQAYWNQQSQAQFQEAQKKSPLQEALEKRSLEFLNWDNSKDKNVTDAPGMNDYVQIGQAAMARAEQDRQGSGALALGGDGASGYAEKLKSLRKAEAGNAVGSGIENALNMRRAEAQGSALPLAQFDFQKNMALTNFAGNQNQSYLNRPRQTPFWQTLLLQGIRSGTSVATAGMGGG